MLITNYFTLYLFYGLVCSVVIYYILFIYTKGRLIKFAWKQKGFFYPILPIIGTSYISLFSILFKGVPVNLLTTVQWIKKYIGYPANFWFGTDYYYLTANPSEIGVILTHPSCYNKGSAYKFLNVLFPDSFLVASYEKWRPKRKLFQSSYKPTMLKVFVPTFVKQCNQLLEDVKALNQEDQFKLFSEHSFVNYFLTSVGLEEEKCHSHLKEMGRYTSVIQDDLISRSLDPIVPINVWLRFFPGGREFLKNKAGYLPILEDIFRLKQEHFDREGPTTHNNMMPLFDLILSASENMDPKEVFDDITFFTAAATETSGNALAFCFMLLGMHPEIQETLYHEVINQVGQNSISSDDLNNLKYTEAVIQETLRLFPTVPLIQRHVGADVKLGTHVVPVGADVVVDIFHVQRDSKYWPEPLKFDPTRFLPENVLKIKPYTYLPFSAGQRDCLGKGQAMTLMKITIASLVRKLKITSTHKSIDEILLKSTITMRAARPISCQFSVREIK